VAVAFNQKSKITKSELLRSSNPKCFVFYANFGAAFLCVSLCPLFCLRVLCVESLVLLLISSVPLRVPLWLQGFGCGSAALGLQGFGCGSAALGLIEIIRVDSRPAVLFSLPR
jgi:hypothetical protein